MEPPALLAPNTAAVASAEPQNPTTSSSVLEAAAGRLAPVDRSTKAMASVWRVEEGSNRSQELIEYNYAALHRC